MRATQVTRPGIPAPISPVEDPQPFVTAAEMVDYEPTEPPKEAATDSGPHLRAALDLP